MCLPAGTAGLKRHISITMEFASQTISPVPDISRYTGGLFSLPPTLPPSLPPYLPASLPPFVAPSLPYFPPSPALSFPPPSPHPGARATQRTRPDKTISEPNKLVRPRPMKLLLFTYLATYLTCTWAFWTYTSVSFLKSRLDGGGNLPVNYSDI